MIPVLAILLGIGLLIGMPLMLGSVGGGIGEFFVIISKGIIYVLVLLLPLLAALAPLWLIVSKKGVQLKANVVVGGALYGFLLFVVMWEFGLVDFAVTNLSRLTGSWFGVFTGYLLTILIVLEGFTLRLFDILIGGVLHLEDTLRGFARRARNFNAKLREKAKR